ncbi:MAG: hypothetical protein ABI325_02220 [Ginsengibacter sp.]
MSENNEAVSILPSKEELEEIENSASQIKIVGERYPEANMRMVGR